MKRDEHLRSRLIFTGLVAMTLLFQGCVSLQIPAGNGKPRIIGLGYAKSIGGTNGQVYEIVAPGLSLRTGSAAPGVSFGWHETRLFYPSISGNTNSPIQPVAIQTKCIGFDFGPVYIMAGFESSFAIPLPAQGTQVIQLIAYSENDPTNTVVERKEIK